METELSAGTVEMAFVRCLYQIEMDRVKYILQSYFRSRINKVFISTGGIAYMLYFCAVD